MKKNKKIQTGRIITIIVIGIFFASLPPALSAQSNANYGTTTFFSNSTEKPVLEKPILGAGDDSDGDINHNNGNDNDDEDEEDGGGIVNPDDIFNKISDTINAAVDNSVSVFDGAKKSLFDMQSGFGSDGSSDDGRFEDKNEFFIAGPRGESPEYMATMKDSEARTVEFDFEDRNLKVAPKKSNLLFTNKEIAIDMTSQYVSIILIFLIATGSAVGYYYVKKGALKGKKEEDYD